MGNKLTELLDLAKHIPEKYLEEAITALKGIKQQADDDKPTANCPHCESDIVVKNGLKDGKQRFLCRRCGKTYGESTNTVAYYSHNSETVWKQVISDTVEGVSIERTAESLDLTHQTVFTMRHKILMALELDDPPLISGVCEADETFVLESYKGKKLDADFWREPRKHGAVAQNKGLSNEYVCVCAATSRDGGAIALTVNRATPSSENINEVFAKRLGTAALVICDGSKSYDVLEKKGVCNVAHIPDNEGKDDGFYNINTTNGFHSFMKERHRDARGFATKYLNRYNVLFEKIYRGSKYLVDEIFSKLFDGQNRHNTVAATKSCRLLNI